MLFWRHKYFYITVIGLFSIFELQSYFIWQEYFAGTVSENSLLYIILYNIGDFNNSAMLAFVVDKVTSRFLEQRLSILLSSLMSLGVFVWIEFSDPADIPAAVIGVIFFACYALFTRDENEWSL